MRRNRMLQKLLAEQHIHGAQINFLSMATEAIFDGATLSCSNLGRRLNAAVDEKHNIKRVDYMMSNPNLQASRKKVYSALINKLLTMPRPKIIVDWSSVNSTREYHIIRASLIVHKKGRALTIFESTYPESALACYKAHQEFLADLSELLPKDCRPIILTDAGFKVNWFELVTSYGWDYIGRVRGNNYLSILNENSEKMLLSRVYQRATSTPQCLGEISLTKRNNWHCHAVLVKKISKHRKKKTVMGLLDQCSANKKIAKRNREPWLLVTSLDKSEFSTNTVVKFYGQRMQIEESFRDTKSVSYGLGLKQTRSKSASRINILLLIAALSQYLLYVIGFIATESGLQRKFQANTVRTHQVLSYHSIGLRVWASRYRVKILKIACCYKFAFTGDAYYGL